MLSYMKRSRAKRFFNGEIEGTHVVMTKNRSLVTFCGPLEVKSIPVRKCIPVEHPNPFELTLFFESNAAWQAMLEEMKKMTEFSTITNAKFDVFSFLTPGKMLEIGINYASDQAQYGDRVRVLHDTDGFAGGTAGIVQACQGSTVTVLFDSTGEEHTLSQYDVAHTFEPLDLVEVVLGRHKGLRGMIVMIEDNEVTVIDEKSDSDLVIQHLNGIVQAID